VTDGAATAPAPEVAGVPTANRAADVVRAALAASIRRLARAEPVARAGEDPEGVHRMRVATRRLRSDLRTFVGALDPTWAESLRRELRWLARILGGAREADVLRERIEGRVRVLPPTQAAAAEPLLSALEREARVAHDVLQATLGSARYVALRARLEEAAVDPRFGPNADEPPIPVLVPLVHRRWKKLRREVRAAGPDPGDATLHVIRIRAKRVRYAAEALIPVGGDPVASFAAAAKELQAVLGEHQDAVAAAGWITRWADGHAAETAAVDVARRLAQIERETAREIRGRWRAVWIRLNDRSLRGWM
jgi:CHAD domain-containing protein